jgi:hypothetical protein
MEGHFRNCLYATILFISFEEIAMDKKKKNVPCKLLIVQWLSAAQFLKYLKCLLPAKND